MKNIRNFNNNLVQNYLLRKTNFKLLPKKCFHNFAINNNPPQCNEIFWLWYFNFSSLPCRIRDASSCRIFPLILILRYNMNICSHENAKHFFSNFRTRWPSTMTNKRTGTAVDHFRCPLIFDVWNLSLLMKSTLRG